MRSTRFDDEQQQEGHEDVRGYRAVARRGSEKKPMAKEAYSQMKVLECNLKAIVETWSDPGDYPSGAGGYALPSYNYVGYVDGDVIIELSPEDMKNPDGDPWTVQDWLGENSGEIEYELDHGVRVTKWKIDKIEGLKVTLTVEEHEGGERIESGRYDYAD
jgi:hypothetical protein